MLVLAGTAGGGGARAASRCGCQPVRMAGLDDFAKKADELGLLRPEALRSHELGTLWSGPKPDPNLSPQEVIELTLRALRNNNEPQPHSGTALLRRFSSDSFALAGEPHSESDHRLPPPDLTTFMNSNQYNLLLEPDYASRWMFPSDTCCLDDEEAWQEVTFECVGSRGENTLLAKLGWSLVRDRGGCWVTDEITWHDFRDSFRPGIGQEEWPRICG